MFYQVSNWQKDEVSQDFAGFCLDNFLGSSWLASSYSHHSDYNDLLKDLYDWMTFPFEKDLQKHWDKIPRERYTIWHAISTVPSPSCLAKVIETLFYRVKVFCYVSISSLESRFWRETDIGLVLLCNTWNCLASQVTVARKCQWSIVCLSCVSTCGCCLPFIADNLESSCQS